MPKPSRDFTDINTVVKACDICRQGQGWKTKPRRQRGCCTLLINQGVGVKTAKSSFKYQFYNQSFFSQVRRARKAGS